MSIKLGEWVLPSPEQMNITLEGMRNPMNAWNRIDSNGWNLGENDINTMTRLAKAGADERKFMRMMPIYINIEAPLYWWKEFDTYKIGTVSNSCSTMHKIHAKEFEIEDFANDDANKYILLTTIRELNNLRQMYLDTKEKKYWRSMIQNLPSSYVQKRTIMMNYEVARNIYHARKHHKLTEWHEFCHKVEELPLFNELILGEK